MRHKLLPLLFILLFSVNSYAQEFSRLTPFKIPENTYERIPIVITGVGTLGSGINL